MKLLRPTRIRVRPIAGVDLVGWDELRAAMFAISGLIGCWLGYQITHLLALT